MLQRECLLLLLRTTQELNYRLSQTAVAVICCYHSRSLLTARMHSATIEEAVVIFESAVSSVDS
jgi:hypothetical protein